LTHYRVVERSFTRSVIHVTIGTVQRHGGGSVAEQKRIRWYNPKLENFEWREVPESDEETLSLLEGSSYTPICTETYRQWRELGSSITVALIRAGEAAKAKNERAKP
jgi:hypothetical protein